MVEKLRPDELEAFKEAFDMFDRNMDGTISTKVRHKNGNCDNLYIIGAVCLSVTKNDHFAQRNLLEPSGTF